MTTYSSSWVEPRRDRCALVAVDSRYQWMLPVCSHCLRVNVGVDVEAWTWGQNTFDRVVLEECEMLGVAVRRLPDTGQYCEGWEARHHALCLTEYRHVFMLDVDTY